MTHGTGLGDASDVVRLYVELDCAVNAFLATNLAGPAVLAVVKHLAGLHHRRFNLSFQVDI